MGSPAVECSLQVGHRTPGQPAWPAGLVLRASVEVSGDAGAMGHGGHFVVIKVCSRPILEVEPITH